MTVLAEPLHCAECGAPLAASEGACWMCRRKLDEPAPPTAKPASLHFHNPSLGVNLQAQATRWVLVVFFVAALFEVLAGGGGALFTLTGLFPALISLAFIRGAVSTARQSTFMLGHSPESHEPIAKIAAAFDFALKAGVVLALAGLALIFALCATCFFTFGLKGS